jgi:hypothetical protein
MRGITSLVVINGGDALLK